MLGRKAFALAVGVGLSSVASAQVTYTFRSPPAAGNDGISWPASPTGLLPDDSFSTPDGVDIYNYTKNALYFDDNYQAAGNSGIIDSEAMWANPKFDQFGNSPYLDIDFSQYNSDNDAVTDVSFDFSWAIAGQHAPDTLWIDAWDTDGDQESFSVSLGSTFNAGPVFGNFNGRAGSVNLTPFGTLDNVNYLSFYLPDIETGNGTSEFAVDNFSVNGGSGGGGGGNENSNVYPGSDGGVVIGMATNSLRAPGQTGYLGTEITNDGGDPTTFSIIYNGGTGMVGDPSAQNIPIDANGYNVNVNVITIDRGLNSGTYTGTATVKNLENDGDPDDTFDLTYKIYDPPQLSDDTASTVNVNSDSGIFISNAAAGPHAGALRAGMEITGLGFSDSHFGVTGLSVGDFVAAGQTLNANIIFVSGGALSGTYNAVMGVGMKMNSAAGSYLNDAQPMNDLHWNLTYTVVDTPADSTTVDVGEVFDVAINNSSTAAAIIGGNASSGQTITMQFDSGLPTGGIVVGTPVDVDFEDPGDLYVLQLTYDESQLPDGFNEQDLRVMYYDGSAWIEAILANSDLGAGATLHLGGYAGGAQLALSHFGVDVNNNQIWAVLDHNTPFAVGVPEPASLSAIVMLAGLLVRRRRAA